jgi:hypothetical protein
MARRIAKDENRANPTPRSAELTAMAACWRDCSAETEDHLGDDAHGPAARGSGDSRDGFHPKTVTTEVGRVGRVTGRTGMASLPGWGPAAAAWFIRAR